MGTSLFNTTPAATYPALIKVGDNTFIDGTLKTLSDGAGNDLPIQVSSTVTNFTGNVGLGAVSPIAKLQVNGTQVITNADITGYNLYSSFNLVRNGATSIALDRFTGAPHFNFRAAGGTIASPSTQVGELGNIGWWSYSGTAFNRNVLLIADASNFVGGLAQTQRLSISMGESGPSSNSYFSMVNGDTFFGSGASSVTPTARLQVRGSGSTSATTALLVQNSGATTSMIVRDDGNVGIGTTNPFALLTVGGQSSFYSVQSAGTGSDFFYSDINPNLTAGANNQVVSLVRLRDRGQANTGGFTGTQRLSLIMENVAGGQFPFQLFSESGALRIGHSSVATPTALVHLKGTGSTAATTPLLIENSAGTQTFKVEDGGVVQIGLTSFITWTFSSNTLSSSQFAFISSSNGSILTSGASSGGVFGNNNGGKVADTDIAIPQVASAVLEVSSTTKGFLPPRMTTAERVAISSPANGLIVFDTDVQNLCYRRDSTWVQVSFTAV